MNTKVIPNKCARDVATGYSMSSYIPEACYGKRSSLPVLYQGYHLGVRLSDDALSVHLDDAVPWREEQGRRTPCEPTLFSHVPQ